MGQRVVEKAGYIAVNGVRFYYESYGTTGYPLIMLHGGLGGIEQFGALPMQLGQYRQVIAVEMQGHGHTGDAADRPLRYASMADDVAGLVQGLGFDQADVLGFSLGGAVALRTAIQHAGGVRRLILISTAATRAGIREDFRAGMAGLTPSAALYMLDTPMYQFYARVAPEVGAWPTLVGKVGDLLREDYDWSQAVSTLDMPILLIAGDDDMVSPAHLTETFGALPNAQIVILPETNHFNILGRTDALMAAITDFLDTRTDSKS
ncbi:MAG: alpha/beta hydrolase [Anaerolineae bacterium]|jgi:pimeloyl-ACP methyl ester carboxylesterase|nr:alpha/beta hydrolase [Anaerolineae bacterium]